MQKLFNKWVLQCFKILIFIRKLFMQNVYFIFKKKLFYSLLVLFLFANNITAKTLDQIVNPESAFSTSDGRIFVSEIGGFGVKNDGRILEIFQDGKVDVIASGLNDPKGLIVVDNIIYVTDVDEVKKVTFGGKVSVWLNSKNFPKKIAFLNDIAVGPNNFIYISDSGNRVNGMRRGGAVFQVSTKKTVTILAQNKNNPDFPAPNGLLLIDPNHLLVADFTSGILSRVNLETKKIEKIADGFGGGDGLAYYKNRLYISDWRGGKIWGGTINGNKFSPKIIKSGFVNPADICITADGKNIVVPEMMFKTPNGGRVSFLPIE